MPPAALVKETDYCGLVSGRTTDKSTVFSGFYGKEKHAPMIRECPANAVCKVVKTVELPNNEVFIGEVVEYYVDTPCLTDNTPDPKKIDPLLLAGRWSPETGGRHRRGVLRGKSPHEKITIFFLAKCTDRFIRALKLSR